MSFGSFEEILSFAVERETEAVAFYEDLARREGLSGNRETFKAFAAEERKHETLLRDFLHGGKTVSEYRFEWIPDLKRSDYSVDIPYDEGMGWGDILRLAMKREEASLKLYNELAEKTGEAEGLALFRMLCQEEAKHKLALETMYDDYMAGQGD